MGRGGGRWWHWLTHSLDLIDDDAYRCVQFQRQTNFAWSSRYDNHPRQNERRLLGPTATFQNLFPTFPPSCSIQFKIHEIHTCAMKKKEENRTDDCWAYTSHNLSVFFFFLGSLCQSYNTFVKEKGHIYIPMIFVNYNFCLPGVKLLSTLTSTWTIDHASTSKWVDLKKKF
jgi:hypothetical protein